MKTLLVFVFYMTKRWQIAHRAPKDFLKKFPEYSPLVLQLLWNRRLTSQTQIDEFFNPDYQTDLHDPFLFSDMEKAVERILKAAENKEKVAVFGDYDADGVTATVLLVELFQKLGISGQVYIPDRRKEGYGLNKEAVLWLAGKGVSLIVTCDCGVSNFEEVELAKQRGIDMVITDHHHIARQLPKAYAIICAKKENEKYPYPELTGVGVAFKLAQAAHTKLKNKLEPGFEKRFLDLVCLGTVADVAPLLGENRTLVKYGLSILKKTERPGLVSLMKIAGIDQEKINTHTIGFLITPRLNAAGRMNHANAAYKLIMAQTEKEAEKYARQLEEANQARQKIQEKIFKEVQAKVEKMSKEERIILEADSSWQVGVVGIVASKVVEEFGRPTLLLEKDKKESRGSARSIPKFNIIEAIASCSDILLEYGGHALAAGFTLENKYIDEFKKRLENLAREKLRDEDLISAVKIDAEINSEQINWELYEQIKKFAPFGGDNEKPVFALKKMKIVDLLGVGLEQKHLKIKLADLKNKVWSAIGFNFGGLKDKINIGDLVDIAFELEEHEWNGKRELQLKLVDLKLH